MDPKRWLTVAIESGIFWPTKERTVSYDGHDFLLRPETDEDAPSVALGYDASLQDEQALLLIRRFLSALAWIERGKIRERFTFGTGGRPGRVSKSPGARMINPFFRVDYLPVPADERSQRCLALYREALNANSVPFQFLGFYKIINVLYESGRDQKNWINSTIPKITDHLALERLKEIRQLTSDVGSYLYESGRCAVAHAYAQPVIDPDDPEDTKRLNQDLPVIQALADAVIDRELGVRSKCSYRNEHLYQLAGFRDLIGAEIANRLKAGEKTDIQTLPRLSLRVRSRENYPSFESMRTEVVTVEAGRVWIRCSSDDGLIQILLGLDFPREFLLFDLMRHISIIDDGSAAAIRHALDDNRFFAEMIQNGELEIWDADRAIMLGRDDPLLPQNVDVRRTIENLDQRRTALETALKTRLEKEAGPDQDTKSL